MSRTYEIQLTSTTATERITADDVQIKADSVKFLNGKGAQAVLVAYFNPGTVLSVIDVTQK